MSEKPFKSGYVAVIGRPNVGKSTLVNTLLKQRIAAVSPRPQTTRRRQLGIMTTPEAQIIFVDTPGLHIPHHKLGEYMNDVALAALEDADCITWLVDASEPPTEEDQLIATRVSALRHLPPIFLLLNKIDLVSPNVLQERQKSFLEMLPQAKPYSISALKGTSLKPVLAAVLDVIPDGEPFYDPEQITDLYEREIAIDLIREACLLHLSEEVPHAIAVRLDEYTDRSDTQSFIAATIFVERESHKGIVIGQGAAMLKKIGTTARTAIEDMSGHKVYLELRVKVNKNWRDNPEALQFLGYAQSKD